MYISIDGLDCCGKTTQIKTIKRALIASGIKENHILCTFEPGGPETSMAIRNLLKNDANMNELGAEAELLLFMAARYETIHKDVVPFMHDMEARTITPDNYAIITDRSYISSFAYQSGRTIRARHIYDQMMATFPPNELPDINVFLHIPVSTCIKRLGGNVDRLEDIPYDDWIDRSNSFHSIANTISNAPRNIVVEVDGDDELDKVSESMYGSIIDAVNTYRNQYST